MVASYGFVWNMVPTGTLHAEQLREYPKLYESDAKAMQGALLRFRASKPNAGDQLLVLAGEPGGSLRMVGRITSDGPKARVSYTSGPHHSTCQVIP